MSEVDKGADWETASYFTGAGKCRRGIATREEATKYRNYAITS
jgi:hypothetical protein